MKHLIIGLGDVGKGLFSLFDDVAGYDLKQGKLVGCKYLHICIPYSRDFVEIVRGYQTIGNEITIIHSTVPVGTTEKIANAVHSPVRGMHPNMEEGLRAFTKYFGGERAAFASRPFTDLGIKVRLFQDSKVTEAMKLWSTLQYGLHIMIEKEIYRWCEQMGLDYKDVYQESNRDYNEGFERLGMPQVMRPWLEECEGKIGGHCIIPNASLLDSWLARLLLKKNKEYER